MGLWDKIKESATAAKQQHQEQLRKLDEERKRQQEAEAERQRQLYAARKAAFAEASRTCPLRLTSEKTAIAGGLSLLNDEFVADVAREWGFSTQKLTITTHRVVWSKGLVETNQSAIYLTDIRDVRFHKPLIGAGKIVLETAGGHSIEGLPFAANGAVVRDRLMAMIHWARQQASRPAVAPTSPQTAAVDPIEQLRKLGELKAQGILNDEEFQAAKAKILSGASLG